MLRYFILPFEFESSRLSLRETIFHSNSYFLDALVISGRCFYDAARAEASSCLAGAIADMIMASGAFVSSGYSSLCAEMHYLKSMILIISGI